MAQNPASGVPPRLTDVFVSGTGGYHTYRIPALVLSARGTVLAFCEGRKRGAGDTGDIDLLLRRSEDGGRTWSEPQVVWDDGENVCGNPTPVVDRETGEIILLLTWNKGTDTERMIMEGKSQDTRRVFVCRSRTDGRTWSIPEEITASAKRSHWRWYATGPGNGIQLKRGSHPGRLLVPANHSDHSDPARHPYRAHVIYSDDHGRTWRLGGLEDERTNESALAELADGTVMQNMRSYHGKNCRAVATSQDGGLTWSRLRLDEALVEPVCQGSLLRVSWPAAGAPGLLAFSNPASTRREKMTLRLSRDDGQTWPIGYLLHPGPAAYSSLAVLPDASVGCLFERGTENPYERISLAVVSVRAIR